jgi:hypothetical protein
MAIISSDVEDAPDDPSITFKCGLCGCDGPELKLSVDLYIHKCDRCKQESLVVYVWGGAVAPNEEIRGK